MKWRDVKPNRRLIFTARIGTDLQIISWIGLQIAYVLGPQRARIWIVSESPEAGFGSHRTNPKCCSTQPTHTNKYKYTLNTHTCIQTHTRIPTHVHIQTYTTLYVYINMSIYTYIHIHHLLNHAHASHTKIMHIHHAPKTRTHTCNTPKYYVN